MTVYSEFSKIVFPPPALLSRSLSSLNTRSAGEGELKDPLGIPSEDCKGQVWEERVGCGLWGRVVGPGVDEATSFSRALAATSFSCRT